ncbi:hypothetical protein LEP1GSC123_2969 [Leptospira borgpetersenii str. 200701203]|uniref:Uncharacterized protein n=1 Tax=Leptospira borgpetersenii str. 200701203 TaxID=1193007 RepID=M3HPD0_LEPBO|nr:hypothetical protein LEP1GSC123_2969 [Leptospira borgpetersenii str. 200701203]
MKAEGLIRLYSNEFVGKIPEEGWIKFDEVDPPAIKIAGGSDGKDLLNLEYNKQQLIRVGLRSTDFRR